MIWGENPTIFRNIHILPTWISLKDNKGRFFFPISGEGTSHFKWFTWKLLWGDYHLPKKISSFNIQNQEISIVTNRDDLLLCHPLNLKDCLAKPGGFFWGFLLLEWGSCSTFHLPSWSFFSKAHVLDEHDAQCHPNHPWEGAERWIFHWQRIEKNGFQSDDKPLPKTNSSSHLQIGRNRAPKGSRNVSQLPPSFGANMLVSGRVIIPIGWVWGEFWHGKTFRLGG